MSKITWTTKQVDVKELQPFQGNPREITEKNDMLLNESLETYGQVKPLVVDADMTVLGGNQRLRHLKGKIWVSYPSRKLNRDERVALAVILNNKVGDWDWVKVEALGIDNEVLIDKFGFDRELVMDMGFSFDDFDFDTFDQDKVIKKLLVHFEQEGANEIIAKALEESGLEDENELLISACKNYEENNA